MTSILPQPDTTVVQSPQTAPAAIDTPHGTSSVIFWVEDSTGQRYTTNHYHGGDAILEAIKNFTGQRVTQHSDGKRVWQQMQNLKFSLRDRPLTQEDLKS